MGERKPCERSFPRHWTRNFPVTRDLESEPCVLWATSTWLVLDLCVGLRRRHRWRRRHELLRHNCGLAVALAWSVHNFNSEQRNCLVILSLSGSDLNLKWKLDLSLIRIVWFRVNVRSVELSSTRTWEFQTPTQDISIPWTQHQGPSLTGNTPHFDLNQIEIDVNFLPPPSRKGIWESWSLPDLKIWAKSTLSSSCRYDLTI